MQRFSKFSLLKLVVFVLLLSIAKSNKRCSKVVLHAWCSSQSTERIVNAISSCGREYSAHMQEKRCRLNEVGDFCGSFVDYLPDLIRARTLCLGSPSSSCSDQCRQQLEILRGALGCCINEMLNTTSPATYLYHPIFAYPLWSMCKIEPVPKACHPSRLSRAKSKSIMSCTDDMLFQRRYEEACNWTTLQPLLEEYESHNCTEIGEDQINSCSIGEDGKWCVEKVVTNLVYYRGLKAVARAHCLTSKNCSTTCRNSLMALRKLLGCCVNNLVNNTFVKLTITETYFNKDITKDALWRKCGVAHPGFCQVRLFGAARTVHSIWREVLLIIAGLLGLHLF